MFNKDVASNFIVGLCFIAAGLVMFFIPNRVFSLILNTSIILLLINGVYLLIRFLQHKKKSDLLFLILSILFALFLVDHETIPQWIIRVAFGLYCYISTLASLIQLVINYINDIPDKFYHFLMIVAYGILGFNLLFVDEFETDLLLRLFGIYFILLGSRYFNDANVGVNPLLKYEWKRKIRISLPTIICAFIPDWTLTSINRYLSSGKPFALEKKDYGDDQILKVMVHVGPNGIQKVGHITFSYKGIVYSYGNYDEESFRLNQTIGDGVFFTVPFEYYIPNMMSAENNSIFEYGIQIKKEQEALIEQELEAFKNNSYRWYCKIEREYGYDRFNEYKENYPSRLHYKTGAKFYKFKSGRFKTYWALGDNCALFTDRILGKLGCDVLSMRGIISPGTYLEYLQGEYIKKNSPVVSLKIHSIEAKSIH